MSDNPLFVLDADDPNFPLLKQMLDRMLPVNHKGQSPVAIVLLPLDTGWVLSGAERMGGLALPEWTHGMRVIVLNQNRIHRPKGLYQNLRTAVLEARGLSSTRSRANTGTYARARGPRWGSVNWGCGA